MSKSPICLSTDVIRAAIADQVRELGGDSQAIHNISCAASYAIICWSLAVAERGQTIERRPGTTGPDTTGGGDNTCAA